MHGGPNTTLLKTVYGKFYRTFRLPDGLPHHRLPLPFENRPPIVPAKMNWESLIRLDGEALELHYRHILEELGKKPGMLGEIFKKARQEIQNPSTLRRLIVDLIGEETWSSGATGGDIASDSAELQAIIDAWPSLSDDVKASILAMVLATGEQGE